MCVWLRFDRHEDGDFDKAKGDHLKPGDRVIWLHSPGRSFLSGWRLKEVPGVVVRVCRRRIRIRVELEGRRSLPWISRT